MRKEQSQIRQLSITVQPQAPIVCRPLPSSASYLPAWKMRDVLTVAVIEGDPGMGLSNGKDIPIKGGTNERSGEKTLKRTRAGEKREILRYEYSISVYTHGLRLTHTIFAHTHHYTQIHQQRERERESEKARESERPT